MAHAKEQNKSPDTVPEKHTRTHTQASDLLGKDFKVNVLNMILELKINVD